MRGRSYTPSPPRGYGRRGRSPSPRGRYGGGRGRDLPSSLLVRNLRHDCRPEDLRRPFGQFGAIKDIYLPKDYYTGEPRGFGFVQYVDPADAADAKNQMDGCLLLGRELTVVFAEENRKKPSDMRAREGGGSRTNSGRFHDRRRSPPRHSRSPAPRHARHSRSPAPRHARHSRSPAPRHARSRSRSYDYASPPPKQRAYSRSVSPRDRRDSRERSYPQQQSRGRSYSRSPRLNGLRSRSQSPARGRSRSPSPVRGRSPSRSRSKSRSVSRSPRRSRGHEEEYRSEPNGGDRSPSQ